MENSIQIEQALFGYRDGHRLIEASVRISGPAERLLLVLSDLSGPRLVHGFDSYLTGYPVGQLDKYAFAKTWYADEMKRPGCVWTHVLLISKSDMEAIPALSSLTSLFQNPTDLPSTSCFSSPISLVPPKPQAPSPSFHTDEVAGLVKALYGQPVLPVVLSAESSKTHEPLVLALWDQQWPALRFAFKFCTGSLSNRTPAREPFDLQVMPPRAAQMLARKDDAFRFVEPRLYPSDEEWVHIAARDLAEPSGDFRSFLWRYGDWEQACRATYSSLAAIFGSLTSYVDSALSFPGLLRAVEKQFPKASEGVRIKRALLGNNVDDLLGQVATERKRLEYLLNEGNTEFIPLEAMHMGERGSLLVEQDRKVAVEFLFSQLSRSPNPFGVEFISGVTESLSLDDLFDLATGRPSFLPVLVKLNPRVTEQESFWVRAGNPEVYLEVLDVLASERKADQWPAWASAIIQSGEVRLAKPLFDRLDATGVVGFLDWLDLRTAGSSVATKPEWRVAVGQFPAAIIQWLGQHARDCRVQTLSFVASVLHPSLPLLKTLGPSPWLRLAEYDSQIPDDQFSEAMAFLLALSFETTSAHGAELAAFSFLSVNRQAAQDGLSYRSWSILRGYVPSLGWFKDWDKCERLRRALAASFIRNSAWPRIAFIRCAIDEGQLAELARSAVNVAGGRRFIAALVHEIDNGLIAATPGQRNAIRSGL